MADYSSGLFASRIGAVRLLNLLKKHSISDKVTWFIPGHTIEIFPETAQAVVDSGAEVGFNGYLQEGIYQMTEEQETDILLKCIEVATTLLGKKPRRYRAPMYTIRKRPSNFSVNTNFSMIRPSCNMTRSPTSHPVIHRSNVLMSPKQPPLGSLQLPSPPKHIPMVCTRLWGFHLGGIVKT